MDEDAINEFCDRFCHWPFVCQDESDLAAYCEQCPFERFALYSMMMGNTDILHRANNIKAALERCACSVYDNTLCKGCCFHGLDDCLEILLRSAAALIDTLSFRVTLLEAEVKMFHD